MNNLVAVPKEDIEVQILVDENRKLSEKDTENAVYFANIW